MNRHHQQQHQPEGQQNKEGLALFFSASLKWLSFDRAHTNWWKSNNNNAKITKSPRLRVDPLIAQLYKFYSTSWAFSLSRSLNLKSKSTHTQTCIDLSVLSVDFCVVIAAAIVVIVNNDGNERDMNRELATLYSFIAEQSALKCGTNPLTSSATVFNHILLWLCWCVCATANQSECVHSLSAFTHINSMWIWWIFMLCPLIERLSMHSDVKWWEFYISFYFDSDRLPCTKTICKRRRKKYNAGNDHRKSCDLLNGLLFLNNGLIHSG